MDLGKYVRAISLFVASAATLIAVAAKSAPSNISTLQFLNGSGVSESISNGPSHQIDTTGAFFQNLGTNGRTCATCHAPSDNFSITPSHLQMRFLASGGTDPVFRSNDGAVCPSADVSTQAARQQAYSLLLDRGLIRVSMPIPSGANFHLESVVDPYNCATAADMSLYRRPLPSTNLKFLSAVMWDGREPSLASQATDATLGHAQASQPPTPEQVQQIVDFESSLYTAQSIDNVAGALNSQGAKGGPNALGAQEFYQGINDVLGADPHGNAFNANAFTIFDAWNGVNSPRRASIARGQAIFNSRPIAITDVKGLNDTLHVDTLMGTCTTCHDTPNAGNHSVKLPIDIGVASFDPDGTQLSYLPQYTFRCDDGTAVATTDPGRAMLSGKCADLGKFKGPILRGLQGRAPYFHNGRARTLADAVDFYNQRFSLNLTAQERADLIAFLESL